MEASSPLLVINNHEARMMQAAKIVGITAAVGGGIALSVALAAAFVFAAPVHVPAALVIGTIAIAGSSFLLASSIALTCLIYFKVKKNQNIPVQNFNNEAAAPAVLEAPKCKFDKETCLSAIRYAQRIKSAESETSAEEIYNSSAPKALEHMVEKFNYENQFNDADDAE